MANTPKGETIIADCAIVFRDNGQIELCVAAHLDRLQLPTHVQYAFEIMEFIAADNRGGGEHHQGKSTRTH